MTENSRCFPLPERILVTIINYPVLQPPLVLLWLIVLGMSGCRRATATGVGLAAKHPSLFELLVHHQLQFRAGQGKQGVIKHGYHHIIWLLDFGLQQAHRLKHAAANAVTVYGRFANFFTDHHGQAIVLAAVIGHTLGGYDGAAHHMAMFVDIAQAAVAVEPMYVANHACVSVNRKLSGLTSSYQIPPLLIRTKNEQ